LRNFPRRSICKQEKFWNSSELKDWSDVSSIPNTELWVEDGSTLANSRAKDVAVEIVSDPELIARLTLSRIVVQHSVDELAQVLLAH